MYVRTLYYVGMNEKYIIGNWKSYPLTLDEAKQLSEQYAELQRPSGVQVVACPPSLFAHLLFYARMPWGAQNVAEQSGTCTGEVTAAQIQSAGAKYVIVGHSERRSAGETSYQINKKIRQCLESNLIPIVCVGELERDDEGQYVNEITKQLDETFAGFSRQDLEKMIIAYEPVWAIGSGASRECSVDECRETITLIRSHLIAATGNVPIGQVLIIYGGSVTPENAGGYLIEGGSDGLLIGRASLDAEKFQKIILAAS